MTIKNTMNVGLCSLVLALSSNANANEAQVATSEQILVVKQKNNTTIDASRENDYDWLHQEKLIDSGKVNVLIEPVESQPGYCIIGLDGFPQKYDLPADDRTLDGKLEKSEMILNLSESDPAKKFYFPCDLKAETPKLNTPIVPPTPITPEPSKEELPYLIFSYGASYLQIFADQDETYVFGGNLRGGSLFLTVQPSFTNWYFGGRFSAYGNASSKHIDLEAPAAEGPLAGQLVMRGTNDYSLESFGIGAGSMVGYMFPFDEKGRWGMGLELGHGIMHDWVTREFKESSAYYINSNLVEGTNISNHSDNTDTKFYGYGMGGLRFKFPFVCGTLSGGIRTDLSDVDGMVSADAAYCPNKE